MSIDKLMDKKNIVHEHNWKLLSYTRQGNHKHCLSLDQSDRLRKTNTCALSHKQISASNLLISVFKLKSKWIPGKEERGFVRFKMEEEKCLD